MTLLVSLAALIVVQVLGTVTQKAGVSLLPFAFFDPPVKVVAHRPTLAYFAARHFKPGDSCFIRRTSRFAILFVKKEIGSIAPAGLHLRPPEDSTTQMCFIVVPPSLRESGNEASA